jgi:hypothetical protein
MNKKLTLLLNESIINQAKTCFKDRVGIINIPDNLDIKKEYRENRANKALYNE